MYDPKVAEGDNIRLLCDVCSSEIDPKERFASITVCTLWGGEQGQGMAVCTTCMRRAFTSIQPESLLLKDVSEVANGPA